MVFCDHLRCLFFRILLYVIGGRDIGDCDLGKRVFQPPRFRQSFVVVLNSLQSLKLHLSRTLLAAEVALGCNVYHLNVFFTIGEQALG